MIKQLGNRETVNQYLPSGSIGCEIGVDKGGHAKLLLLSKPKEFHLIDYWKGRTLENYKKVHKMFSKNPEVKIHRADVFQLIPTFSDGFFDWIYLDAWHNYEDVIKQIEICLPKLKKDGIMAGHDFQVVCWKPKQEAGVVRAVIESIQRGWLKMVAITNMPAADWVAVKL